MSKHSTIIIVILLLILFRAFFYHHDTRTIQDIRQEGPYLFIRMSDGHYYEGSHCKEELKHPSGISMEFTAIGPHLTFDGERILAPVLICCKTSGFLFDGHPPLR